MLNALLLIFEPIPTWERIFRSQRSLFFIFWIYLVPLLVITSAGEAYRLVHWERPGVVTPLKPFSPAEAAVFESAQFLLSLGIVFIGAKLVKSVGETFHGRHTFTQAFTTVAYSLGPLFVLRMLDWFTGVPLWLSWPIGIVLSIAVLYHGVPRIMQPDPPHAFGLFLMSSLLLLLISGLARFVAICYLMGKFGRVEIALFPH
jgi:hypothetical protein